MRVSLLLNAATPIELAECCPFIDEVYGVPFTSFVDVRGDPKAALALVPSAWDYVIQNDRVAQPEQHRFAGFHAYVEAAGAHFEPTCAWTYTGREPPSYRPHQHLRIELPAASRASALASVEEGRRGIAVVLAGSSGRHLYPSASSWELILCELARAADATALYLLGKLDEDGRTTSRISRAEVERLLHAVPAAVDCFDRPLLEQLAIVEASDLLLSPHTGFAFAASTVGTPWLALSGGNWHEYFFNGVPVYSVLPDTERYPAFGWAELGTSPLPVIDDDEGEGPRTPSMSAARIREDLPELLRAARLLIDGRLPYESALADYFPRLLAAYGGDRSMVFSFDGVHERYLN